MPFSGYLTIIVITGSYITYSYCLLYNLLKVLKFFINYFLSLKTDSTNKWS